MSIDGLRWGEFGVVDPMSSDLEEEEAKETRQEQLKSEVVW